MSFVTQCPSCGTHFRAVQDQLRISDGWVRCGRCGTAFDARESLQTADGRPDGHHPQPDVLSQEAGSAPDSIAARGRPVDLTAPDGTEESTGSGESADNADLLAFSAVDLPLPEEEVDSPTPQAGADSGTLQPIADDDAQAATPVGEGTSHPAAARLEAEPAATASFMRARGAHADMGWFARTVWLLLGLALAAGLAAQLAYQQRDRLVVQFPEARPWVTWACGRLGCTVSAPRQVEALVIESSSFSRVRGDLYRLLLTMRNVSTTDVALPSLELSLIDAQEQVVARRVLAAADLFPPGQQSLAAGAEWNGQMPVQVQLPAGSEKFSGFKVYAFYP